MEVFSVIHANKTNAAVQIAALDSFQVFFGWVTNLAWLLNLMLGIVIELWALGDGDSFSMMSWVNVYVYIFTQCFAGTLCCSSQGC